MFRKKKKRKVKATDFKAVARRVNTVLKKDFDFTLNFKGYDDTIYDLETLIDEDLKEVFKLIKESNEWSNYFGEISNLISYYAEIYNIKKDVLIGLKDLNDNDIKYNLIGSKASIYPYLKRFKVESTTFSDIEIELNKKIEETSEICKDFKMLLGILEARVKYFEYLTYSLVSKYGKNFDKLYF